MKRTLSILGAVAALAVAATVYALPSSEVEVFYFSDATLSQDIGYQILTCSGARYREGKTSRHYVRFQTPCHSAGQPLIGCVVNGVTTTCPASICNSGLFSCN